MLIKIAKLICNEIFEKECNFDGNLCEAQYKDLLKTLEMILNGLNTEESKKVSRHNLWVED